MYNIQLVDIAIKPNGSEIIFQNSQLIDIKFDTLANQEYTISGRVVYPQQSISYGVVYYRLHALASMPSSAKVQDYEMIYLDSDGNQLDEATANILLETKYPVPTPRPDLTVIVPTPFTTPIWRTAEPGSPAYPPPEATLPPYP